VESGENGEPKLVSLVFLVYGDQSETSGIHTQFAEIFRPSRSGTEEKQSQEPHVESPKRVGRGLLISCARATRGRGRPSPGLMARPGKSIAKQSEGRAGEKYLPVGGRVRKLRAVGDQSAPVPERKRASLEGPLNGTNSELSPLTAWRTAQAGR